MLEIVTPSPIVVAGEYSLIDKSVFLVWNSQSGSVVQVEATSNLVPGPWVPVQAAITARTDMIFIREQSEEASETRSYRVTQEE